ncbi:MAG TPA: response regulator [Phycisphaerales bacterium]|nr:response regulator [Phycisphaerales bacterium]
MAVPSNNRGLKITAAERPNTLNLNQRDLVSLVEKLEAGDKNKPPVRREFSRWPFRHATIRVVLSQPSGAEVTLKLACRNLSRGGCSLLHNAFVHPGSTLELWLPRLNGKAMRVEGTVRRCQHRRGVLHEMGVQFSQQIDLRDFLGGDTGNELFSLENVNAEKLKGKLLLIEDNEVDVRIFRHFLRETSVIIEVATTGEEGLRLAEAGSYDLVVADWRLPGISGVDVLQRLRNAGHRWPALVVTADPVGLMRAGGVDLPDVGLMTKPLGQQPLMRTIAERLLVHRTTEDAPDRVIDTGIHSDAVADVLARLGGRLEAALAGNDGQTVRTICIQIKGCAPSIGLHQIAKVADQVAHAIGENGADLARTGTALRELIAACKRGGKAAA